MSLINTLAPRPLNIDSKFGYEMLVTIKQTTKQNLKCLLLTAPKERMMDPEFGVGLKKYLFENAAHLEIQHKNKNKTSSKIYAFH